ncbi:MAG: hypothetical protein RLZ12_190, partial [Bacillota bacterium]
MDKLHELVRQAPLFWRLVANVNKGLSEQYLTGLRGASKMLVAAVLKEELQRPVMVVTYSADQALCLAEQLSFFTDQVVTYLPIEHQAAKVRTTTQLELMAQRARLLDGLTLLKETSPFFVASIDALKELVPSKALWEKHHIRVAVGQEYHKLAKRLVQAGYEHVNLVTTPGEFSVRGNLLDLYPLTYEDPVRLDFFGEQLESIRFFSPEDQRTISKQTLSPRELTFSPATMLAPAVSLFTYFNDQLLILCEEWVRIKAVAKRLEQEEQAVAVKPISAIEQYGGQVCYLTSLSDDHLHNSEKPEVLLFASENLEKFHGKKDRIQEAWQSFRAQGWSICLVARDEKHKDRLKKMIVDYELTPGAMMLFGQLKQGFTLASAKLALVTEQDLFGSAVASGRTSKSNNYGARIKRYQDLREGDYVVHFHNGIGQYLGLRTLVAQGVSRDYLQIKYAKNDKLYIPVEQLGLVQKYVGQEGVVPRLDLLGSGSWERTKKKTKKVVEEMAEELIELYAKREAAPGYAFAPDTSYQAEFELDFPYEETPDQLRSITEIKAAMERPVVMDRLLCGDVGYGKTEVAMRAVFKAVMDKKQVAFLTPTTILAEQHYQNFCKRFQRYPVEIDLLS